MISVAVATRTAFAPRVCLRATARPEKLRSPLVARAKPEMKEKIEEAIEEAKHVCEEGGTPGQCAAAWDNVEELSAEAAHQDQKKEPSDPLEEYCQDNPETDECRVYED